MCRNLKSTCAQDGIVTYVFDIYYTATICHTATTTPQTTHCLWGLFCHLTFATKIKDIEAMKIKLTKDQIQNIVSDPDRAAEAGVKVTDPWWVVVLKVVKYIIELVLAGAAGFASGTLFSLLAII